MEKFKKVLFFRTLQQTILILAYSSLTLTMDAASVSETPVYIFKCARRHISECILTRKLLAHTRSTFPTTKKYSENLKFG
jgi:hypothetical protein